LASKIDPDQLLAYYLNLIQKIFKAVRKELGDAISLGDVVSNKGEEILASSWTRYLHEPTDGHNIEKGTRRRKLYDSIFHTVRTPMYHLIFDSDLHYIIFFQKDYELQDNGFHIEQAKEEVMKFMQDVHLGVKGIVTDSEEWKVLVAIDEVHALYNTKKEKSSRIRLDKTRLDFLISAMNELRQYPVCFILLSTQSDMAELAPSSYLARSLRQAEATPELIPPITETPFDCIRNIPMHRMDLDMLHDPVVMSLRGRPLYVN
jgi:hypothetical protein